MEEGETKFEMGHIQLATRLGVSVNNTCTTPYAARCVASTAHAKILLPRISIMYAVFFMRAIFIFYEGGVAQFRHFYYYCILYTCTTRCNTHVLRVYTYVTKNAMYCVYVLMQ